MTNAASLNSALIAATTGLRAAQSGLDVVTRNVSNSQVEGYTRKTAPLETMVFGDSNGGVRVSEISRSVSEALLKQLRVSSSSTERLTVEDDFLGRFETLFGKPGDDVTIAAKLGSVADAFRAMTVSPDLSTAQSQVLNTAQAVVQNLNLIASNIRALREEADGDIASSVDKVNDALVQIADLNSQIASLTSQNKSTADLEDQRDVQLSVIAGEMDISYFKTTTNQIFISTSGGRTLLDSTFSPSNLPLSFTKTPAILPTAAYYPPPSSAFSGLSGVEINGVDISLEITGGKIGGYLNIRDEYLPETMGQLDELATRLIQNFNFNDLQLFQNGTQSYPTNLAVQDVGGVAASATTPTTSTVTVQSTSGLSVGMTMKFASHNTVYEITSISGSQVTFEQVGVQTGLAQAVNQNDYITFGPSVPTLSVQTAASVGQGTASNPIQLNGLIGAQAGMRIKFANDTTIYTITQAGPQVGPPALGANQIVVQPDGNGTGLQAAISANETIQVLAPAPGVTGTAASILVNPAVVNNPWRTRDGSRVQLPSGLTGNNTLPTNIVSMFEGLQTFSTNTGLSTSSSLENFAASIIGFEANRRAATTTALSSQTIIRDNFDRRVKDDSGVNVDQELAFMLQVQNSYSASARTITAVKDMMDQLLQIV